MLFHFGRSNSVEPGDGFVDHPRRCLRHRRRHESGRYSRHSPSLGAGSTPLVSRRLVQPARCLRLHARLRHVPGRCAIDDRRAAVAWPTMLVPPSTTAGDNFPGVTANVSVAAAPAVMAVTVTTMVIVTTSQLPGCRVGYARDNFRRPPSRLRSNCRRRRTLYFFRSPSTPGTNSERSPGHWPGHSRARASHGASRDTPSFRRDAAALRSAEASVPATASESTTAATADDVGAGASDDADDKSFGQSVGASTDGLDSSPHTSVRARGRDCSTQTPWRLRPAGFAGVDSPIAFHEILVLLYALRRVIVTPERTGGAELAKTATAYDGLRSGALFNDMGRQARRGSSVCS